MSELKSKLFGQTMNEYGCDTKIYLKSEADKVIAEKDKEIARLDDLAHAHNIELLRKENLIEELKKKEVLLGKTLNTISESHKHVVSLARKCNHVNYKRCLAMAMWCDEAYHRECGLNPEEMTDKEFYKQQIEFWPRWSSRWLAIAEKFKEAK